ncbi:TolC family protein [Flavobacterium zepuense]|uniref:TolC family protein n=1 Tax=Flavobacterium zepuense TaxID=2593302 RepID=A0A552V7N8_9FLAO|nr:TolC family protein [Flavobacterium zepuense]TRW26482.1 TolC family protein [Flavobacterium zepuense]
MKNNIFIVKRNRQLAIDNMQLATFNKQKNLQLANFKANTVCQFLFANCLVSIANFKQRTACQLPIVYCLLILFSISARAQKPGQLTLQDAISNGMKNNPSIQSSQLDTQMQTQLLGTGYDIAKTQVNGTFGQINTHAQDKNFNVSQTFSPFVYGATRKLLKENVAGSQLRLQSTKQDITYSIRQSWNAILYYAELNKMLRKQNALMERFVRSATLKFETGESNSLEKITAVSKQQELEQQIKQNEALLRVEKSKIRTLLHADTDFTVGDTSFVALPSLTLADTTLVKQNSNIQLASQEVKVAEANRKVASSALWPDITAGYFIQSFTGNQEVNGQTVYYDGSPRFQGFSVGLSLPIFVGSASAKIKAAKTNVIIQKTNAEYLQLQMQSRFQQEMEQLITYEEVLTYYKTTALPNAETIAKNAGKAYQNGDISYVEYVQVLETALDIRTNYIQVLNNYNTTVINLQYLVDQ